MGNRSVYKMWRGIFTLIIIFGVIAGFDASAKPKKYTMTDFGAINDGETLNTVAIQSLIDKVNRKGGGTIVFPAGKYLSGSLQMKSNVNLHLQSHAVLLGSTNPLDYPQIEMPGRPKLANRDDNSQMALLVAHKANDFTISGEGKIDGQGRALALTIDSLHHAGVIIDPKYSTRRNRPHETARPKLFRFSQCKNVFITDLNLYNGACWGLSFELCENLNLDHLKVVNRAYWNNDGMDITDCTNVKISNCDVNSADDGICLKSYYPGFCNDTILIENCVIRSSASAIKFGTASFGGFKNVNIKNIQVYDTFRSAIAIESVDGGIIENIEVSNIVAENTGNAIFIRLGHRGGEKPGVVKNVHIHDIKVQVPFGRPDVDYDMRGPAVSFFHNPLPSSITGIPGHNVEDIVIENVEITCPGRASKGMAYVPLSRLNMIPEGIKSYPEFTMFGELPAWGLYVRHAKGITLRNVKMVLEKEDYRPAFVFDQVEGIRMDQVELPDSQHKQLILKDTKSVKLSSQLECTKREL
ncbi:glycoside hydrolase family 28 protein [Saccharicrinis sp. GN24d3]|uniref:glycoside hydrolase family 28 protein n=1 Tax=Saccharicrinis sp. GN24d3 TaxID=3458416 RepID=UPI0040363E1A